MSGLQRLGRRIAEEQDALRARSPARALLRDRIAAHEPRPARRSLRSWQVAAAFGVLAMTAALALWLRLPSAEPLTLRVGSAAQRVSPGAWLEAPVGAGMLGLDFSDGTHIDLAAGTRARVVEIDAHGAHLMIESGLAHVAVVHHAGTEYRLSVGPFAVRVVGTRFDVRWKPDQDELRIDLAEGRVELSGCVFGRGYALRAGQAVGASCRRGQIHVEAARDPARAGLDVAEVGDAVAEPRPNATKPGAEPAPAVAAVERAEAESTKAVPAEGIEPAPAKAVRAAPSWRALARRGEYAAAFAAVEELGFEDECARADREQLALLAEVARYAGERAHEASALLLMRQRFAGTPRAALAAFALGRLEFDERHAYAKAARWFDTYLKEQPAGALCREAHGRLMEAALAAGDRAWARTLAADYLRLHPGGPHAELANELLEDPAATHKTAPR